MDALAVAREAQASRLSRLAPPPPVAEPEPQPEPEQRQLGSDGDAATPPPVRSMVADIIDCVIDESSGWMAPEPAQLALPPAIGSAIDETVSDAAARVAADLITQASRAAAARVRREGGEWHPQIDAFWVDSSRNDAPSTDSAVGDGETGPIRVGDEFDSTPGSRVWHAGAA